MNFWDIVILAIIALAVVFAVLTLIRKKDSGCHGSCSECSKYTGCSKKQQ